MFRLVVFVCFRDVVAVYSRFLHVGSRPPVAPHVAHPVRVGPDGLDENQGSDDEGPLEDIPGFVLDEEDQAQDAAADFDAGAVFAAQFGHDGRDHRTDGERRHVRHDFLPALRNFWHDIGEATPVQWFFHFFPLDFLVSKVIPATNVQDPTLHLNLPLLMNYLSARLIISCHVGLPLETFWTLQPKSAFNTSPFLGDLISGKTFTQISAAFRMSMPNPLAPPDRLREVRGLWEAVNAHWQRFGIVPGWLCCNDESMASFISRYCPAFTKVDRKPKPMGNLLHTGCDARTKIMYVLELQEGKDRPPHLPLPEFSHLFPDGSKTGPLMMRLCKPLFGTGSVVIHDSGFACIPALVQLKKTGVYASCLLKKKRFWPKYTHGGPNDAHMATRALGDSDAIQATFGGEDYAVYLLKDSTFTLQLAATYGKNEGIGPMKKRRHETTNQIHEFQYPEPIAHYYEGRHAVDDHNHLRQGIASIEEGWQTKKYHHRMFAVALGLCETNSKLCHDFFCAVPTATKLTNVQWRMRIVDDLLRLYPPAIISSPHKKQRHSADVALTMDGHVLNTRPHYGGEYVGRGPGTICGFRKVLKKYQQISCHGTRCPNYCRTYCGCDPHVPLCTPCYVMHVRAVTIGN